MITVSKADVDLAKQEGARLVHHPNDPPEVFIMQNVPEWFYYRYGETYPDTHAMIIEVRDGVET